MSGREKAGENGKQKRKRHVTTLKGATLGVFVVLIIFFMIMFGISAYLIGRKTDNDYKTRAAEANVHNAVAAVESSLTNYNYLTRLLMTGDQVVAYLKAGEVDRELIYEARHGIYEIQNLYNNIDSVYIFRNDMQYVSTERADYSIDFSVPEYQRILDALGSTVVSINGNGMVQKANQEPLLTLSRAIYDIHSQKRIGILIMNISGEFYTDAMSAKSYEPFCIFDTYGNVLCGDERLMEYYFQEDHSREEVFLGEIRLDSQDMILAGTEGLSPLIIIGTSGNTSRKASVENAVALLLTLIAFLFSIGVWMLFISTNIVQPINQLGEAMEKTKSSGWLEKIYADMPGKEFAMLAESYNKMIEYLNELFNRQMETEKNIQKAEMRVLQEQIKPHFLYNTLETISYLAVQENAPKTHDALETLGNFYRNFLNKGSREIQLKKELRITEDYIKLQKLRYGEVFEAEYDIDRSALDCMIPKLILQPLVENAICHGIRMKGELGVIRISAMIRGDDLLIQVYDSGVGMTREQIENILQEKIQALGDGGFGLAGTISRIQYFCNDRDVVRIRSECGEFTEIEIRIPHAFRGKRQEG